MMKRSRALVSALITAALATGCYGTVGARVSTPDLVYIGPNVQVVSDFDYPVFYSDSAYWRYDGGVWYQSRSHDRDWVRTVNVPVAVRQVDRPEVYVHYHADGRDQRGGGEHRGHR
jgi:hypothetical protein